MSTPAGGTVPLPTELRDGHHGGMTIPHSLVDRYRDTWLKVFDENIDIDFARASLTELTYLVARAEYPDLVHRLGLEDSRRRSN